MTELQRWVSVENLAKRGPLANTRKKKNWQIMVNRDVDSYAETLNHRKIIRKI